MAGREDDPLEPRAVDEAADGDGEGVGDVPVELGGELVDGRAVAEGAGEPGAGTLAGREDVEGLEPCLPYMDHTECGES